MIGGLSVGFREWFGALIVSDGVDVFRMLPFSYRNHTASLLWVDTGAPGVACAIAF